MKERLEQVASAMRKRGFLVTVTDNADQAASFIRESIPAGAAVAVGGSMTVKNMGLHTQLREDGHKVLWHWEAAPADRRAVLLEAMQAPYYICSANAVTEDGLIVQLDGTGNRVAALCYGPSDVYMIIGRNKIVEGGYQQAVRRIKQVACPANARRLNLDTPCAKDGKCNTSACTNSMCNLFLSIEGASGGKKTHVILVNEDLGF